MNLALQALLFFRRKMLETLRQPVWVVMGLTVPLLYLALFAPLLKSLSGAPGFPSGRILDVFIPGILVLLAFGSGMGAGWVVIWEMESGVIERFRVTPGSRLALLLGTVLRDAVTFVVPAVLVVLLAIPFGFHPHWIGIAILLVLLALLTVAVSAASSAVGITLKDVGSVAAVVTGLQLPLTLLAGVLLPLSLGPDWLRTLGHLNPLYYAVEAGRDLASGTLNSPSVDRGWAVVVASAIAALWWGTRSFRRAMS